MSEDAMKELLKKLDPATDICLYDDKIAHFKRTGGKRTNGISVYAHKDEESGRSIFYKFFYDDEYPEKEKKVVTDKGEVRVLLELNKDVLANDEIAIEAQEMSGLLKSLSQEEADIKAWADAKIEKARKEYEERKEKRLKAAKKAIPKTSVPPSVKER